MKRIINLQIIKSSKNKLTIYVSVLSMIGIIVGSLISGCNLKKTDEVIPDHVFVYAENQSEDYPTTRGAYKFASLVNEKTNGRIKIIVKCNAEAGDEKSVVEQLEFGGIDFTRVSISTLSDNIAKLRVIQMPYLYSDEEAMWKVLDGDVGREFSDAIEQSDYGIKALSWYDAGARNFYSVKPLYDISDLTGLNIRVQESDMMAKMIELLGANPVRMTYSEVYMALKTGKIDAAENNWTSYSYSKHYEQAKYCLVDEHIRIPEIQLISEKTWAKLTAEEQDIISECARESAVYERELWQTEEHEAKEEMENKGVIVTKISDEERATLREKLKPLYDEYCIEYMDIIDRIRKVQE